MREEIDKNQQNEPEILADNSPEPSGGQYSDTHSREPETHPIKNDASAEEATFPNQDDGFEKKEGPADNADLNTGNDAEEKEDTTSTSEVSKPDAEPMEKEDVFQSEQTEQDEQATKANITGEQENVPREPEATKHSEESPAVDPVNENKAIPEPITTAQEESKNEAATARPVTENEKTEDKANPTDLSEVDESTHNDGEHDEELYDDAQVDYSKYSKKQITEAAEALLTETDVIRADKAMREIKPYFDAIENEAYASTLEKFRQEGGNEEDFRYRADKLAVRFQQAQQTIRERKAKFQRDFNQQKENNLTAKQDLLTKLRELIDSEETTQSIDELKEVQKQWKAIGPVPGKFAKSLWASYNALINLYYDNRSIYFELKELDRKKNLEAKLVLCEKAESLAEVENVKTAIKELDMLHEEFKHVGPVPKEEQEPLWDRFKAASNVIHARRREHVEGQKETLYENLKIKKALCEQIKPFAEFNSDSIREWNEKTKKIKDIQSRWEQTGNMPREEAKEVNKEFWSGFKKFFNNKGHFFKKLDSMREENLRKKEELIQKAEDLKTSTNWQQTAEELKKLQQAWKDVGPVPDKHRESIYKRFKAACDEFFNSRRASFREEEKEYDINLKEKQAICEQIEKLAKEDPEDVDKLMELGEAFQEIGFVPKNAIKSIQKQFNEVANKFLNANSTLDEEEKQTLRYNLQFMKMKNSPNAQRKLGNRENALRKQISKLEDDISLWRNNLSFFASSKKADKLKADFEKKIKDAVDEVKAMKQQLRVLHHLEDE